MAKKTIWLINQYASTPATGVGGRHYCLAKELVKQGYTVYLIAASYHHTLKTPPVIKQTIEIELVDGINFVWVKTPNYDSSHSKKRIFNWLYFTWKLLSLPAFINVKADVVFFSSPSLIGFLAAKRIAHKYNARLVFEVRDIWPLTLVELGGYSTKHLFIRFMQGIEDDAYKTADKVVSNLPNACEHMEGRGMNKAKFTWIPNGFSYDEIKVQQPLPATVVDQLPKNKFLIGYAGSIGHANALNTLIQAANILKNHSDIAFIIVGQGREKSALQQEVANLSLNNVVFIDPISKNQIQAFLQKLDVCYIGLTQDPIFRFGVSPNKLFDYLISAKPIIYAIDSANKPVDDAKCGVSIPAEDAQSAANAIQYLKNLSQNELQKMGQNGKDYVIKHHDYAKLATQLADVLFE